MTRRVIVFIDKGKAYQTSEFNGDKAELEQFGSADHCDKNWEEIETEFRMVETLDQFVETNGRAQGYYHSCIANDQIILPVVCVSGEFVTGTHIREIKENLLIEER
jgi:hypothetical protein